MPRYRLLHLSGSSIQFEEEIEAEDDVQAVRIAENARASETLELWRNNRRLKRLEPGTAPACE
jgi:hypothetical protein